MALDSGQQQVCAMPADNLTQALCVSHAVAGSRVKGTPGGDAAPPAATAAGAARQGAAAVQVPPPPPETALPAAAAGLALQSAGPHAVLPAADLQQNTGVRRLS